MVVGVLAILYVCKVRVRRFIFTGTHLVHEGLNILIKNDQEKVGEMPICYQIHYSSILLLCSVRLIHFIQITVISWF